MIYHSTPFFKNNIADGINRFVELVPEDAWVCVRDADTMFLTFRQQYQIEKIVETTDYGLIGCMVNRTPTAHQMPGGEMSHNYDILHHVEIAQRLEREHWAEVIPAPPEESFVLAGHFLLFPKRVWADVGGFSAHVNHDVLFSKAVSLRHKVGVAQGLYLFHAFRPGNRFPIGAGRISHVSWDL